MTPALVEQLAIDGYVVVQDAIDVERTVNPLLIELSAAIGGDPNHPGSFAELVLELWRAGTPPSNQVFDISLPQDGISDDTPFHAGPAAFNLITAPELLDHVEQVVGPEIFSNPIQHVRVKVPEALVRSSNRNSLVTSVPWHQDQGVLLPEADGSNILTVWVALTEATTENGCLQVIPGSHRDVGLLEHCVGHPGGVAIPEHLLPGAAVPVPLSPGSAIFMDQRTVHSSLPNVTDSDVRISLDLRYQAVGEATGRPMFASAGFVARSVRDPGTVLDDAEQWRASWASVRQRMSETDATPRFNRWRPGSATCA